MIQKWIWIPFWSILTLIVFGLQAHGSQTIGWLESIRIYPGEIKMRAKMDTGAKSSSLNVGHLRKEMREGETWVVFNLQGKAKKAKVATVEKKVVRTVKIKKKGGGLQERFVVNMDICLAGIRKQVEISLVDRSNFNYQVLIGRDDLDGIFIIDPSKTFTRKPLCKDTLKIDEEFQKSEDSQ